MSFIVQPVGAITDPQNIPVTLTANSAGPYLPGTAYTWQITDLDSYVTYTVAAIGAGTCTVNTSTGVITYTPGSGGSGFRLTVEQFHCQLQPFQVRQLSAPQLDH